MKQATKESVIAVLIVFILGCIVVLLLDGMIMPIYTRHNQEIEVPDVVEMTWEEADSALRRSGFRIILEDERYDNHYPAGVIIDQNPEAFSVTKPGRRVYVTVSSGEQMCIMPNLVGKSTRDAEFALHAAGLTFSEESIGYEYSFYYPSGVVMAQSIPPGTRVKKDTPIHMTASLGNIPAEIRVPNLLGQPLERAKKLIITSGMVVGDIQYKARNDLLPNTVIEQFPPPDQKAEMDQRINLIVSKLEEKN